MVRSHELFLASGADPHNMVHGALVVTLRYSQPFIPTHKVKSYNNAKNANRLSQKDEFENALSFSKQNVAKSSRRAKTLPE